MTRITGTFEKPFSRDLRCGSRFLLRIEIKSLSNFSFPLCSLFFLYTIYRGKKKLKKKKNTKRVFSSFLLRIAIYTAIYVFLHISKEII